MTEEEELRGIFEAIEYFHPTDYNEIQDKIDELVPKILDWHKYWSKHDQN